MRILHRWRRGWSCIRRIGRRLRALRGLGAFGAQIPALPLGRALEPIEPVLALRRGTLRRGETVGCRIRRGCGAGCAWRVLRHGGQWCAGNDAAYQRGYELRGAVAHPGLPFTHDATRYLPFLNKELGGNEPQIRRGCGLNWACAVFVPPRIQAFCRRYCLLAVQVPEQPSERRKVPEPLRPERRPAPV